MLLLHPFYIPLGERGVSQREALGALFIMNAHFYGRTQHYHSNDDKKKAGSILYCKQVTWDGEPLFANPLL